MLGLLEGSTQPPGMSPQDSRAACGNVIDRRALSWLLGQAPVSNHESALDTKIINRQKLASLTGKLQFCAELVPGGQSRLTHCYRARDSFVSPEHAARSVKGQWRRDVVVHSSSDLVSELKGWRQVMKKGSSRRYYLEARPAESGFWKGVTEDSHEYLDHHWQTSSGIPAPRMDASGDTGGIAFRHKRFIHVFPPHQCKGKESSNFRELYMFLVLLQQWGSQWRGQRVLGRCDNTTAVSIINRQGSHAPRLHQLSKRIFRLARFYDIDLAATHIVGELNQLADGLSRYIRQFDKSDWMYNPDLFQHWDKLVGPHTVDAQADPVGNNAQLDRYWSVVDSCYDHPFAKERIWANTDFSQVGPVIDKYKADFVRSPHNSSMTMVVPVWPKRSFWRKLKGAKILGYHPVGSDVFSSPHWERLRRGKRFSMGSARVPRGPIQWPCMILHFPAAVNRRCSGTQAAQDSPHSAQDDQRRRVLDQLPTLSGRADEDMHLLSTLQATPLSAVQPDSRPCDSPSSSTSMHTLSVTRGHRRQDTEEAQRIREQATARRGRTASQTDDAAEVDTSNKQERGAGLREVRLSTAARDCPTSNSSASSPVPRLLHHDSRTSGPGLHVDQDLRPGAASLARPGARGDGTTTAKPVSRSSVSPHGEAHRRKLQKAVEGEAAVEHQAGTPHVPSWIRQEDTIRTSSPLDVHVLESGDASEKCIPQFADSIPHHQIRQDQVWKGLTSSSCAGNRSTPILARFHSCRQERVRRQASRLLHA